MLTEALGRLDERLPLEVPVLVGEDEGAAVGFESTDPGAPGRMVATPARAGPAPGAPGSQSNGP